MPRQTALPSHRSLRRPLGLIVAYWRGACPPWLAVFGVLIGGRIAVAQGWKLVDLPVATAPFVLLLTADAVLAVWQVVGAWRSVARGFDRSARATARLAGLVTVALAVPVTLTLLTNQAARQVAAPPPRAKAPRPLTVENGVARLKGEIDYDLLARFEATPAGAMQAIDLDSPGGNVFAARALALRVAARGLTTRVTERCYSACTLIFVAGARRELGPKGRLGFHGYALETPFPMIDVAAEEATDRAWMRAHGVSAPFVARAYATPNDQIWRPGRQVLAAAGVLN